METKLLPVSEASARLFLHQCIGGYSGHMAEIAFSPTTQSIAEAHGVNVHSWSSPGVDKDFARFLRMVADRLDGKSESQIIV